MREGTGKAGYTVIIPAYFHRRAERFLRHRCQLRDDLARVIGDLGRDPFLPALCLPALRFAAGLYAVRLTYSYRLLVHIEGRVIVLVAIGSHEAVYRHREGR